MIVCDEAALSARNLARRCVFCGAQAQVTRIGCEAEYATERQSSASGGVRFVAALRHRAIEDVDLCLPHGLEHWPWASHKERRQQRGR